MISLLILSDLFYHYPRMQQEQVDVQSYTVITWVLIQHVYTTLECKDGFHRNLAFNL